MAIKFLNSVAVDTDVLFVDTANERVGIGTVSPSALLDVGGGDGTPAGTQFRAVIKGTGTRALYLDSDGSSSSLWWGAGNTPHFAIDSQNGGGAAFWTYSNYWSRRMDITAAGDVGIGTPTPGAKLDVSGSLRATSLDINGNADISGTLTIPGGWATTILNGDNVVVRKPDYPSGGWARALLNFQEYTGTSLYQIGAYGSGNTFSYGYLGSAYNSPTITWYADKKTIFHGNVGIGTTSPSGILSVSDGTYDTLRVNNGASHLAGTRLYRLDSEVGSSTAWMLDATGNSIIVGPRTGTVQFSVVDASENVKFIVDNGNVGIGTTSPSKRLDIRTNGVGDGITLATSTPKTFAQIINGNSETFPYGKFTMNYGDTTPVQIVALSNELQLSGGYTTAGKISFRTATSEQMRLTSTGLGIGTTSPGQKLHVEGNARVTGAYYDSGNTPGTVNQLLASTATGTAWIDPGTIVAEAATLVVIACKNTSGATIPKGTPVYQTGNVGATATIEIAPADALISANKLPAIGLLQTDLNNNGFGNVVITGELTNFTTDPIDGLTPTTGDKVFVKSGGGLTLTKPTGEGNGIQNMGLVGKVSGGNAGSITVSSIMRTNDVPNLPEGRIWVGDGNTIVSDTVYIDEPNNRLGIGTTSPGHKLTVNAANNTTAVGIDFPSAHFNFSANSTSGYTSNFRLDDVGMDIGHDSTARSLNLQTGNLDRVTILGNGNVGIGTTAPSAALEVVGGIKLSDNSPLTWATSNTRIFGQSGYMQLQVASTDVMRITSGGNVGIGTTSPVFPLQVTSPSVAFCLDDSGASLNKRRRFFQNNNQTLYLGRQDDNGANNVYDMVINSSGNVGIGTTSPDAKLQVAGGFRLGDGAYTSIDFNADPSPHQGNGGLEIKPSTVPGSGTANWYTRFASNVATGTTNHNVTIDGNVGIGTTSPSQKLTVEGNIELGTGGYIYGDTTTSYLRLNTAVGSLLGYSNAYIGLGPSFVYNVGGSEKFRISSASGYVGIGTTSPGAKLHVSGDPALNAASTQSLLRLERPFNNGVSFAQGGDIAIGRGNTYPSSQMRFILDNGTNSTANPQVTVMALDSNGNVGIGTTAPSTPLHINNAAPTIRLQDSSSGDNHYLTGNNGEFRVQTSGYMTMRPGNTVSTTFLANGNVGIGTTSPSYKLDVNGDGYFNGQIRVKSQGVGNSISIIESTSGNLAAYMGESAVGHGFLTLFEKSVGEVIKFDANGNSFINRGNVGIGTTSPVNRLEIVGPYASTPLKVLRHGDYGNVINIGRNGVSETANIGYPADSTINLSTSGSERMRITSAGNVGIGTTSPGAKLDVAGGIKVADDTDTAGANKVGTLRYRTSGNNSYVDMCMQTGASAYAWINVVQNNW